MSEKPLRLGVVGCGWAGQQAVDAGMTVPRTTVTAIADLDEDLRKQTASEYEVPRAYSDYTDLLDDAEVDAVYLAVNPPMRHQMVLDALDAGKHTLVQKPHAVRAPEILEFEAAAARAGKTLQFCYFMRHYPANRKIRAAIRSGKIGTPYHARIFGNYRFLPKPHGITRWLQVYGQKGGALGQHYSHELDLAWFWMGCPRPEWAIGAKHSVYPVYRGSEGPAEDYFSGLVGLEGGKTIQIDCTRFLHSESPTLLELYGREGAVSRGQIARYEEDKVVYEMADEPLDVPHTDPPERVPVFYYEIEHFAMAVAGEVEPDVNASDSYQFMRILDALYDSARDGVKVLIPSEPAGG